MPSSVKRAISRAADVLMGRESLSLAKPDGATRVLFATDLHGSTRCFRQLLRLALNGPADVVVVGGDVTGKRIVPIVRQGPGERYWVPLYKGRELFFTSRNEANGFESQLADEGIYSYSCDEPMFAEFSSEQPKNGAVWQQLVEDRVAIWGELAAAQMAQTKVTFFFNAGNDDFFFVDDAIDRTGVFVRPEGKVVAVDGHLTMISCGYANLTPFLCPRDVSEDELERRIAGMAEKVGDFSKCIFNLHCPPQGTALDKAAKLDDERRRQLTVMGVEEYGAGSVAVRRAIEQYQPAVALHGHIHESAAHEYIGGTLCINPGSEYSEGILRFALMDFVRGRLIQWGRGRCEGLRLQLTHWFNLVSRTAVK